MIDPTGSVVVALIAAGMGVSFVSADRHSPTSWLLGVTFWCVGGSIFANVCLVHAQTESSIRALSVIAGIHEAGAMIGFHEWILRVRRTIPARGLRTTFGDRLSRFGEVAALVYLALAIWLPDVRAREFVGALQAEGALGRPAFYLFFVPSNLSILSGLLSIGLVLRRRPDPGERTRLLALCAAGPLLATGLILPLDWAPIAGALGEIVFLIGALRYHVFQGQRGQFLGRFLSPQVAEIVRSEGLAAVMRESTAELSVVACDLRGFTRLSEATSSQRVIQVLREYYDAVGGEAAELGGTIKDLAGDGILILVGAPLPYPDHASRAVRMAERIRDSVEARLKTWREGRFDLGIGIGVASGFVTVGAIGGSGRLEYVAVGAAVNLASRLCDRAAAGEILLDQKTVAEIHADGGSGRFQSRPPVELKGFSEAVAHFALAPVAPLRA